VPDSIDAVVIRRWCAAGLERLRLHEHEINELNVFPVPDGDTGTNLVLTVTAAAEALAVGAVADRAQPASPERPVDGPALGGHCAGPVPGGRSELGLALHRLACGALLGARGNSGVILAQILRGVADALATSAGADGGRWATALGRAALAARAAVAEPVEGTMLTVAAAAAAAADATVQTAAGAAPGVSAVVSAAARAAREALARTPEQLPALARAGVVDAGGRGLVVLLDTLAEVVTGRVMAADPEPVRAVRLPLAVHREAGSERYGYEVQYLLDAPEAAVEILRQVLGDLGDSLVVVGAGGAADAPTTWNVHVHVNDVGAAIEAGVQAGRPYRISVTRFADQLAAGTPRDDVAGRADAASSAAEPTTDLPGGAPPAAEDSAGPGPDGSADRAGSADRGGPAERAGSAAAGDRDRGVVVICRGGGLSALFTAEGAVTVTGPATGAAPSTAEILAAIRAAGATHVVVLPNERGTAAVASAAAAAAREEGISAGVVPTRSPVQALAAIAVRDPSRRFEDDVIAMAEAAGACRYAEVTVASREALTVAGRCHPGDVLALVDGEVNLIGRTVVDTCRHLLDRLLSGGGELVTLILGDGAPADLGEILLEHLAQRWPFVEAQCYDGGQPVYPLLVGVE